MNCREQPQKSCRARRRVGATRYGDDLRIGDRPIPTSLHNARQTVACIADCVFLLPVPCRNARSQARRPSPITMILPRSRSATRDDGICPCRCTPAILRRCGSPISSRVAPQRWIRGHWPIQLTLVAQCRQVRQHPAAVGDQHRNIDQHPATVMHRNEPAVGQRPRQTAGQTGPVGEQPHVRPECEQDQQQPPVGCPTAKSPSGWSCRFAPSKITATATASNSVSPIGLNSPPSPHRLNTSCVPNSAPGE